MSELKRGQKLFHYAYGPLTITNITYGSSGNYVETTDDYPEGFRQKADLTGRPYSRAGKQTWILEAVGHWLFESPDQVGKENNNWDWRHHFSAEQNSPIMCAKDKKNHWHQWYFDNGYADIKDLMSDAPAVDTKEPVSGKRVSGVTQVKETKNRISGVTVVNDSAKENAGKNSGNGVSGVTQVKEDGSSVSGVTVVTDAE